MFDFVLSMHWAWWIPIFILVVAIYDMLQKKHTILHNFPVVGHLRYWLEKIGPELRQYWVAHDKEELPFNRSERSWVYASSKGQNNTFGFGTSEQIYSVGYPIIKNATFPYPEASIKGPKNDLPCLKVIGENHDRAKPFQPTSVINISAMSFGSLGSRAVRALNLGAKMGNCFHNTGEGGISQYHCEGGDLVFQMGTGYFGCRKSDGTFCLDTLMAMLDGKDQVKAIEIKLSQGAKPGKGGILPGQKVTPEIAKARKVEPYKDVISPNAHSAFGNMDQMIDFIELVAKETGLPVGIKSAIGKLDFWYELARRMKERKAGPDFIVVDGGEGGTGAAPLTFADHVSLPFKIGFGRVYHVFQQERMSSQVVWAGAGKLGFPDRAAIAFAMGCDFIYVAREAMMAIGCIQAQRCHTDHCPAGIATQNKWLQAGLNVEHKAQRFAKYLKSFRKELRALAMASGYQHPQQFTGRDIEVCTGVNEFTPLNKVLGYDRDPVYIET